MRLTFAHDTNKQMNEIKHVTLDSLQDVWAKNSPWSQALESKPPSKFVRFLNKTCKEYSPAFAGSNKITYSIKHLRCLALLWCDDDPNEKVIEFWNILLDKN